MGDAIQGVLVERGHRVRVYTPYGAILPGMAYLVRRLLENTSNESFLKASLRRARADRRPAAQSRGGWCDAEPDTGRRSRPVASRAAELPPFRNEPLTDFAIAENREAMPGHRVGPQQLGRTYPLLIGGQRYAAISPARFRRPGPQLAGRRSHGGCHAEHAQKAVAAARKAVPGLVGDTRPRPRAAVLIEAAGIMRQRRFELAAWEVFECGKPWREADADVAEAIDFCEFYAREMMPPGRAAPHATSPARTTSAEPSARRRRRHPAVELPAGDSCPA